LTKGSNLLSHPSLKSFPKNNLSEKEHGFTLIELIVVIIIVGILAALGLTQYSTIVEKSRLVEAKVRIGTMRQLVYQYYLENGSLAGIQDADVGVDYTCTSSSFYAYYKVANPTNATLGADRCPSGGRSPNPSRRYVYYLSFVPGTGQSTWHCYYTDDSSSCFGLSP
jgi:prepilin-type N-terminal cleavage/methylation domain-containing protein